VRTKGIPVVVLSAVAEEAEKSVTFAEGAQDYLVKPFSPGALVSIVRQHLPP
jgi:two-component system phosphate regulon response regulator PhoB